MCDSLIFKMWCASGQRGRETLSQRNPSGGHLRIKGLAFHSSRSGVIRSNWRMLWKYRTKMSVSPVVLLRGNDVTSYFCRLPENIASSAYYILFTCFQVIKCSSFISLSWFFLLMIAYWYHIVFCSIRNGVIFVEDWRLSIGTMDWSTISIMTLELMSSTTFSPKSRITISLRQ